MATQVSTVTEVPFGPPSVSAPGKAIDASAHTYLQSRDTVVIPPSELQPHCHHLEKHVTEEVNAYFLKHWRFPNEKSRKKFVHAGFSTVTCWYFPTALNDRIHFACRLLTLLFLIDGPPPLFLAKQLRFERQRETLTEDTDLLEHMSLAEGEAYNNKLMPIARGDVLPDRHVPVEYIMYDLWESMRACDREMANQVLEPVFTFMRAQTDPTRLRPMDLKEYFEYRERDVGKGLLAALMRFCMGLRMSTEELAIARPVDMNCSKHLSIINDIWSFEKELLASKTAHKEGGALCTGVAIFAEGAEVSTSAAKRVLYALCREWEERHKELEAEALAQRNTPELRAYLKGLEHQMSGNEMWSRTTLRYRDR